MSTEFDPRHQLDLSVIQHISEFISVETVVYLFPLRAFKILAADPTRYTYEWACQITEPLVRNRILLFLLDKRRLLPDNCYLMDFCSRVGNTFLLERILNRLLEERELKWSLWYSHRCVDWPSKFGHVHILEWWRSTCERLRIPFRYSQASLDLASNYGQLNVLDWWEKVQQHSQRILFKYTKDAIDRASSPHVLDWWLRMHQLYGIELKYSTRSIDYCKDTQILDWWLSVYLTYGIKMKYKMTSINSASANGDKAILNWWFLRTPLTQVALKYSEHAIDSASAHGHLDILEWWLNQWEDHRFTLRYSTGAIDLASENGHLNVLEWWFARHLEGRVQFKRTINAVNQASRNGHVHILDWWILLYKRHKIPFLYDSWAIEWALDNPNVMHWWVQACSKFSLAMEPIRWNRFRSF